MCYGRSHMIEIISAGCRMHKEKELLPPHMLAEIVSEDCICGPVSCLLARF